jgi:hypothetical protein
MHIHPNLAGVESGNDELLCRTHSETRTAFAGSDCLRCRLHRVYALLLLIAIGRKGSETGSSICFASSLRKPLAGIGAALFLLAFATIEALAAIRAIGH